SVLLWRALRNCHERLANQLDLDAVGILEVHRLLDAAVGPDVRNPRAVEPALQRLERLWCHRDGNVLNTAEAFRHRLEAEAGEVEEREHVARADVEEEVRRAFVVAVLEELYEREAEHVLVEGDRALGIGTDQREVMHPAPVRRGAW